LRCGVNGFSLLELILTISIAAILCALVIPAQTVQLNNARSDVASAQLLKAINLARSEALLHGTTVTLCASRDHVSCQGNWQDGQILFLDKNKHGAVDDTRNILSVFDAFRGAEVHWRSSRRKNFLSVTAVGRTGAEDGTFWYCLHDAKNPTWAIRVTEVSRARLELPDAAGEIVDLKCRVGR
jgi:type IV fimbrial biogenesis protein FimT